MLELEITLRAVLNLIEVQSEMCAQSQAQSRQGLVRINLSGNSMELPISTNAVHQMKVLVYISVFPFIGFRTSTSSLLASEAIQLFTRSEFFQPWISEQYNGPNTFDSLSRRGRSIA